MKIAYVFTGLGSISGKTNGILTQALTWANGLQEQGVEVDLVNPWDGYDFSQCDIIHTFAYGPAQEISLSQLKSKYSVKIAISPIIDTNRNPLFSRIASRIHIPILHLYSPMGSLRASKSYIDGWFVRSDYEGNHIKRALNVSDDKIYKVMLSNRLDCVNEIGNREPFCLQVCYLPAPRKNVFRLVDAAIKYNFRLVLAGNKFSQASFEKLLRKVAGHDNIEVLGRVSDADLLSLYRRARVFALPSLQEGVGLVALEAAANGCDIVMTNRGAPKEYYNEMAEFVDPMSVDQIGLAVKGYLGGKTYQPRLLDHIKENFSTAHTVEILKESYLHIIARD